MRYVGPRNHRTLLHGGIAQVKGAVLSTAGAPSRSPRDDATHKLVTNAKRRRSKSHWTSEQRQPACGCTHCECVVRGPDSSASVRGLAGLASGGVAVALFFSFCLL